MKNSNTYETLKKRNTPFTWIVLFVAAWFFVPSLFMTHIWFDLKSVHINEENILNEDIEMIVEREIIREFNGFFEVSIRKENGTLVCQGRPDSPFIYRVESKLPIPVLLSYWIGGPEKMTRCRKNGFGIGTYYVDTCHTVVIFSNQISFARRCVKSNKFTVVNPEVNPEVDTEVNPDA